MNKILNLRKFLKFLSLIILLAGCSIFSSNDSDSSSSSATVKEFSDALSINENNAYLLTKGDCYKKITLTLNVTTPKSIYFIFSNKSGTSSVSKDKISVSSNNLTFSPRASNSVSNFQVNKYKYKSPLLPDVSKLLKSTSSNVLKSTIRASVSEGSSYNFYEVAGSDSVVATCRRVVSEVNTTLGNKTLNIWVADDCWTNGGTKDHLITQEMVDSMANKFLKPGLYNDIYDWVTNVCGEEWGDPKKDYLLPIGQPIDILLCDIQNDNANGSTLGYFWSGNNYKKSSLSNSNEKIMFCIDAPIYATCKGTWSIDSTYQRDQITTLAHEFQHMINYYQLTVKNGVNQETWLDEMLAMSMEDLVAYNIYGDYKASPYNSRFSEFNFYNYSSLAGEWNGNTKEYAIHYAFASYLLRQYDGANFVKSIYSSGKTGTNAVESVTGLSFFTLQRNWGAAYLLSDKILTSGIYAYNADLSSSLNSITYDLSPINAFTQGTPTIYVLSNLQNVNTRANVYYKVAENLAVGTYVVNIIMNSNVLELTVVSK